MTNNNTTVYIKKLVKIVYEKERQIETMKRALKEKNGNQGIENIEPEIQRVLRRQMESSSSQLNEVNCHVLRMERRVCELEQELKSEMKKNDELLKEKKTLEARCEEANRVIAEQYENMGDFEGLIRELAKKKEKYECEIAEMNKKYEEQVDRMKEQEQKLNLAVIKLETERSENRFGLRKKSSEIKIKEETISSKDEEIQNLNAKLSVKIGEIDRMAQELEKVTENYESLSNDNSLLKLEVETLQEGLNMKEGQSAVLSQSLKDYQEFAFQISQYIESAYSKHCCHGKLKSSKKLIRGVENCGTRFEAAFYKMNQLQLWMDSTVQKLQKIIEQHELPNETLGDLSIIARSFEEKLELCDLTERLERQKLELDKNEEMLLDNLQKQIEKSDMRHHSKLVELDEIQEVLKVTKDINRQLLNEINGKEYIISECRKHYSDLLGGKSNPEFRTLKNLLNLKK